MANTFVIVLTVIFYSAMLRILFLLKWLDCDLNLHIIKYIFLIVHMIIRTHQWHWESKAKWQDDFDMDIYALNIHSFRMKKNGRASLKDIVWETRSFFWDFSTVVLVFYLSLCTKFLSLQTTNIIFMCLAVLIKNAGNFELENLETDWQDFETIWLIILRLNEK